VKTYRAAKEMEEKLKHLPSTSSSDFRGKEKQFSGPLGIYTHQQLSGAPQVAKTGNINFLEAAGNTHIFSITGIYSYHILHFPTTFLSSYELLGRSRM